MPPDEAVIAKEATPSMAIFAATKPDAAAIEALESRLLPIPGINAPELACPVVEDFAPGIYMRTIFMQAGKFIIGHEHRKEHFNFIHSGRALVNYDGEVLDIRGPCMFKSAAGVRKMLVIIEDMTFTTIHANPDDCRDTPTLDDRNIRKSDSFVEYQAQIDALKAQASQIIKP